MIDPAEILKRADQITAETIKKKEEYEKLQQTADLAIQDLLHDLELAPLSGVEMLQDAVQIRDWRRVRRHAKNMVTIIKNIGKHKSKGRPHVKRQLNKLARRDYSARVLTGLKINKMKWEGLE